MNMVGQSTFIYLDEAEVKKRGSRQLCGSLVSDDLSSSTDHAIMRYNQHHVIRSD